MINLHIFNFSFDCSFRFRSRTHALRLRLRSREELAEHCLVVEVQGDLNSFGHAKPVFRCECWPRIAVQPTRTAAIGSRAGFPKPPCSFLIMMSVARKPIKS